MRSPAPAAFRVLLAAVPLSLACCTGVHVTTDFDPEVDFGGYRTFSWLDPPLREAPQEEGPSPLEDPFTHNTLLDKRVRDAVEKALVERGYRPVQGDAPGDFQLRYEVVAREVTRDSPVFFSGGYGYGYGRYGYLGSGVGYASAYTYQEGTLILDVIDPKHERIAWRGWAPSRTRDGHIDAGRVVKTVDAILVRFPPPLAAAEPETAEE